MLDVRATNGVFFGTKRHKMHKRQQKMNQNVLYQPQISQILFLTGIVALGVKK